MNLFELFLIAVGLSMDAFAVAVSVGLSMTRAGIKSALVIGLYFGVFQALMPLIGYLAAMQFADKITTYAHWVAFALLCLLGGRMIAGGLKKEGCPDRECPAGTCPDRECPGGKRPQKKEASLKPSRMLPLALATSIDALAVGVSFAVYKVSILLSASLIGLITLAISTLGVKIGCLFGTKFKSTAELTGGIILVLIGIKILLEHIVITN